MMGRRHFRSRWISAARCKTLTQPKKKKGPKYPELQVATGEPTTMYPDFTSKYESSNDDVAGRS